MEEMRSLIAPELELIESRIVGPTKELQSVMKLIRKSITKRDHKVRVFTSKPLALSI
jgi:amphiphysin